MELRPRQLVPYAEKLRRANLVCSQKQRVAESGAHTCGRPSQTALNGGSVDMHHGIVDTEGSPSRGGESQ